MALIRYRKEDPGTGVLVIRPGHTSDIVKMHYFLKTWIMHSELEKVSLNCKIESSLPSGIWQTEFIHVDMLSREFHDLVQGRFFCEGVVIKLVIK